MRYRFFFGIVRANQRCWFYLFIEEYTTYTCRKKNILQAGNKKVYVKNVGGITVFYSIELNENSFSSFKGLYGFSVCMYIILKVHVLVYVCMYIILEGYKFFFKGSLLFRNIILYRNHYQPVPYSILGAKVPRYTQVQSSI